MSKPKMLPPVCGYQGYEFGASYPDSICHGGRLYDADNCDSKGNLYEPTEDIPCPMCHPRLAVRYWAERNGGGAEGLKAARSLVADIRRNRRNGTEPWKRKRGPEGSAPLAACSTAGNGSEISVPDIVPGIEEIRARLAACTIPLDARSDWDGTNHYEITTEEGDAYRNSFWWLNCIDEAVRDGCRTEDGRRLGAVLDYAAAYRRDVGALIEIIDGLKAQHPAQP